MIDKDTFIALILPVAAAVFGFFHARRLGRVSQETKGWVTTRGRVVDAKIAGWGKVRHAQILYEFNTPAKLIGSQICAPGCEENNPQVYIRFYRVGKEINVHYNPNDPQQCLLELPSRRIINGWRLLMAIGLGFPVLYVLWLELLKT